MGITRDDENTKGEIAMQVEQFVMAYRVEQDRLRAILPPGFESLRPVLRINGEIRRDKDDSPAESVYVEFNTPVEALGRRGWLNIAHWHSSKDALSYTRAGAAVTFASPFLKITYIAVGITGGCPAEKDNDGCFFIGGSPEFAPAETIDARKEFCDCEFAWMFADGDAHGISMGGKSLAVEPTALKKVYEKQAFTAQAAAAIPCEQIVGAYAVRFSR